MTDFVTSAITETGYLGIFLLMLAENIFPPIPSEIIMPFAGLMAARGELSMWGAVAAGTLGTLVGALPWFALGWYVSGERRMRLIKKYGVFFSISTDDMERATQVFTRWQRAAVFFGRLMPIIRTLISVPAGSIRMRMSVFLLLTVLGSMIWNGMLLGFGYILEEQYHVIGAYIDPISYLIIGSIVALYLYRIARHIAAKRRENDSGL